MAFALGVEMLNLRMTKKSKPVQLKTPYREAEEIEKNENGTEKKVTQVNR
jgi:hypothetical protein